jgi:hypothetical protein
MVVRGGGKYNSELTAEWCQVDMSSQPNSVISRTPESPRTPIAAVAAADHLHVPASKYYGGNNTNGDAGERRYKIANSV